QPNDVRHDGLGGGVVDGVTRNDEEVATIKDEPATLEPGMLVPTARPVGDRGMRRGVEKPGLIA
ncbi:MAG: hypothetical protein VYC98_15615, partial [Planctomycetota bacterium]|nr:hypothetical protein [Planctomycetota bacterium]